MKLRRRAINTWISEIQAGWGDRAAAAADSVTPLVMQWEPQPNWHQVGVQLASHSCALNDAVEWLRLLGGVLPRRLGKSVMHPTTLTMMASGWAAGELLHRAPNRDVAPIDVLRMRLRQHFQQAEELGVNADAHAAIVVVDLGQRRTESTTAAVTRHTHTVFNAGETLAASPNGNLLVLTPRDHALAERTQHLSQVIRADHSLDDTPVRVWVEPIGQTVDHLDSYLHDLAS
jgi:hypothetical protein